MKLTHSVGIDIGSESVVASVVVSPAKLQVEGQAFSNDAQGHTELESWLAQHKIPQETTAVCLEATGVYGEQLAYHLRAQGWRVFVIPPLEVKRAFAPSGPKNDPVDSRQIGEYGLRFPDKLHPFTPRPELLEQVKVLLQLREQYVRQKTAHKNSLRALQRKVVRTPLAESLQRQSITQLEQNISAIEEEIRRLFNQDADLNQQLALLLSIPGVGLLFASHFILITASLRTPYNAKVMASHLGICPHEFTSGKSVRRRATSRRYGPATMRKLLHLAARSRATHVPRERHYYLRKLAAGKPKQLVLNNLANRLVRICCAMLRDRQTYIPDYRSVHPVLLLTKS